MTTALEVLDRATGELLDLAAASDDRLGEFLLNAKRLRGELADAERQVADEIRDRMDRSCSWTMRAGGAELKAPSPTAGVDEYPPDMLREALCELVDDGVIAPAAAEYALKRQLTLTADVPWDANLPAVVEQFRRADIHVELAGQPVSIVAVEPQERAVKAGVNALRKNPATHAALDSACVIREPVRRVTVKPL